MLLAAMIEPPSASAAPFELRASLPDECPDPPAIREALERHLGRAIAPPLGDGFVVELHATAERDGRWRSVIAFDGPSGRTQRALADATDCAAAMDAAALVIAIAIDPSMLLVPEPEPTPTEPAAPVPAPVPVAAAPAPVHAPRAGAPAPPPVGPPPRRWALRGAVGVGVGPTFGGLPRTGALARVHGALLGRRWRAEVGGSFAGAPAHAVESASLTVLRWTVDARGCAVITPRRWLELLPCAGAEFGQNLARPQGLSDGSARADPWIGLVVAPRLVFHLGRRAALYVEGDAVVPLQRRSYTIDGIGVVHRTAPVVGAALAGAQVRFP